MRSTGAEPDVHPPLATADVDHVEQLRGLVDHGAQLLALADRADPADDVPGRAFGPGRIAHDRLLRPDGGRQFLHRQLAAHRDDRDHQVVVGDDHERLEDLVVGQAERLGGLASEVVEVVTVYVLVDRVVDPRCGEGEHGRRHGHTVDSGVIVDPCV